MESIHGSLDSPSSKSRTSDSFRISKTWSGSSSFSSLTLVLSSSMILMEPSTPTSEEMSISSSSSQTESSIRDERSTPSIRPNQRSRLF